MTKLYKITHHCINFLCNKPTCWRYSFSFVLLLFTSCKNQSDINHAKFDTVFKKLDSTYIHKFSFSKEDIASLDSVFAVAKDASTADLAKKYFLKIAYCASLSPSAFNTNMKLQYADSLVYLLQSNMPDSRLANLYVGALFAKGDAYFSVRNYDEAIRNYTLGKIALSDHIKDSCMLRNYYFSMATVLYAQQKYLLAARFFRMKYLTATDCGTDAYAIYLEIQENMDNTGMCYAKAGLTDSANWYYNATLEYINKNEKIFTIKDPVNFEIERAVVYRNQAEVLYMQHDTTGAESLFLKSIESSKTYKDRSFTTPLLLSLATLYLESSQPQKAGGVLQRAGSGIDSADLSASAANYNKLLADYYVHSNKSAAAHYALLRAYNMRDSLEKRDRQFNSIDVRREFENREQKAINQGLKKDNEIKNGYLLIAAISAAMAIVIIFMIWSNSKRKTLYVKKLTYLNDELVRKNVDLQQTLGSLEQSHRENNRIMKVVAHDLKNPISAVRTLVYSLLKKEQTPANRDSLQLIHNTCADSITLIKDLLDNKRSLSEISKELVDMGRLIEQCTELFQAKAGEKNQRLNVQVDYPVIMLNRQKIWRVISNIVNNAIKFSPANAEITISLERKGESVLLSVRDSGIGIPSELKDKIFTLDPDTSREGTAGEESYGLGLSISRKIIEEHAGQLWFESEAGKGSVFYVELPYCVN